jgi:hypothetical protein
VLYFEKDNKEKLSKILGNLSNDSNDSNDSNARYARVVYKFESSRVREFERQKESVTYRLPKVTQKNTHLQVYVL